MHPSGWVHYYLIAVIEPKNKLVYISILENLGFLNILHANLNINKPNPKN